METVFRLNVSELNIGFLETLKSLFSREKEVEVVVHPAKNNAKKETRTEYFARLTKAKANIERGNVVRFTPEELEIFAKKIRSK